MDGDLKELLCQTLAGEPDSARALWCALAPGAVAFARSILRSQPDAEDVVQIVMCRLLQLSQGEARSIDDVRAYLLRAIRNQCITHLRTRQRRMRIEHASRQDRRWWGGGASRHPATDELGGDVELRWLVERLPRREREVIILKHASGLTFDQIAAALDAPRSTVASRYQIGLDRLRSGLAAARAGTERGSGAGAAMSVQVGDGVVVGDGVRINQESRHG